MKLAHFDFENVFELSPGIVNVLVIEPENYFFKYCSEIQRQINGGEGCFVLSENDEILNLSKCAVFTESYWSFQVNERKVSSKLYSSLAEIAETKFLQDYRNICQQILEFLMKLNAESECPICFGDEVDMSLLFKMFGVDIEVGDTFLEKLLAFMRVQSILCGMQCFFFVNLKTFLTEKELKLLYHEVELMESCIFLIENTYKPKLPAEHVIIIDRDLCEILA